jgi:hypothetical protein
MPNSPHPPSFPRGLGARPCLARSLLMNAGAFARRSARKTALARPPPAAAGLPLCTAHAPPYPGCVRRLTAAYIIIYRHKTRRKGSLRAIWAMMRAQRLLLLVMAAGAVACVRGDAGKAGVATPLFAWSSGSLFGEAGRSVLEVSHAAPHTRDRSCPGGCGRGARSALARAKPRLARSRPKQAGADLATLLGDLVEGMARPDAVGEGTAAARLLGGGARGADDAPEVVLVLLGSEVRAAGSRCQWAAAHAAGARARQAHGRRSLRTQAHGPQRVVVGAAVTLRLRLPARGCHALRGVRVGPPTPR